MDAELGISFTTDTYDTVLVLLESDEDCQLDGLMVLSNLLVYGNSDLLAEFPCGKMAEGLVNILKVSTNEQNLILASQCIHHFLEAHPESTRSLVDKGVLTAISLFFTHSTNAPVIQNLIKALGIISEYRPKDIGEQIGISPFLKVFDVLKMGEQRIAVQGIMRVTEVSVQDSFYENLSTLMALFSHADETVITSSILAFGNIIQKINKEKVPIELISKVVDYVNTLTSGPCAVSLLRALTNLSQKDSFAEVILSHQINYKRLLFEADFKGNTGEVKRLALNVVINLLPDTEFPNDYWRKNNRNLKGTPEFAKQIQPLLIEIILSNAGWETLTLAALAATMTVSPLAVSSEILNALAGLVMTPLFAPFVLLVTTHLPDPAVVVKAGILPLFKTIAPEPDISVWYASTLGELLEKLGSTTTGDDKTQKKFDSFNELCEFIIKKTDLSPYDFYISGILTQTHEFLKTVKFFTSPILPAIEKIVDLAFGILKYSPIPRISDPLSNYTPDELLNRVIMCSIKTPEENIAEISIGIDLDFSGLEAWYNSKKERVSKDEMLERLKASEYKDIVILENPDDLYFTQRGLIHRALQMPKMKRYHFKIGDNEFSAFDSFFHSIVRSLEDPAKITTSLAIEFLEGDSPRAPLKVPKNINEVTLAALYLLETINKIDPLIVGHRKQFDSRILGQISSPLLTIGLVSPSSQILYHFPFLFNFEIRHTFFRIIGLDLSYSLPFINNFFYKIPWNNRINSMRVKCHLRRKHLFEDGLKMLKAVGPGMLRIDVFFDDEEGIGAGPTQEFFTLFSLELCRRAHGLWRHDSTRNDDDDDSNENNSTNTNENNNNNKNEINNKNENNNENNKNDNKGENTNTNNNNKKNKSGGYCWSEKGLFPRPDAPADLFYTLGLLCGKAILMDMILTLPLNPAFIKLIRGGDSCSPISCSDVDPILDSSLNYPEGLIGLNFTYPGLPSFEMVPNGSKTDVTAENVSEYVRLVRATTTELPEIVKAFREAFSTIVQWETLRIFSDDEFLKIINGQDSINITEKDLKENVEISHGYTEMSPQVAYLFETILEMTDGEKAKFFKFLTGCERLPIGGLKALKPRLTIAVRAPETGQVPDNTLPSVLTCANYLKVPEYSSKRMLRDKLLLAINEGQGSFLLT